MKAWIGISLALLIFVACGSKTNDNKVNEDGSWNVTITGKVSNPQQGVVTLQALKLKPGTNGPLDSIKLDDKNMFSKQVRLTEPGYYQLNFYNKQVLNVILYKSNIEINVDGSKQDGLKEVKGSPEQDVIETATKIMNDEQNMPDIVALKTDFTKAANANDAERVKVIQGEYMRLNKRGTDKVAAYLKKQPASLAVMELLQQGNLLSKDEYNDVYADQVDKLKKEMPNSEFAKMFIADYEKSKPTAVGSVAPEIILPDVNGKMIKLSSFRGRYVLVDFWAKWCAPCRAENPNVVKAYHKFHPKGFEVFGVSLDRDKADWVKAIKDDGLVWTQVSDLKNFQTQSVADYNIEGIPFSILINPKGVIVAKNLRGSLLDAKLTEVYGKD